MKKRFITGIFIGIFLLALLLIPGRTGVIFTQISCIILLCTSIYELFNAMYPAAKFEEIKEIEGETKPEKNSPSIIIVVLTLVFSFLYFINVKGLSPETLIESKPILLGTTIEYSIVNYSLILIYLTVFVLFKKVHLKDILNSIFIVFYVGIGFSSLVLLKMSGTKFLVYALMISVFADSFALSFGVLFGKHKMAPVISPKKTWEGAIGGTLAATIFSTLFAFFYGAIFNPNYPGLWGFIGKLINQDSQVSLLSNFKIMQNVTRLQEFFITLGLSLFASWISVLGDLVASKIKRIYKIKDFGNIFPGHGGVLDRFDSTILTSAFLSAFFLILSTMAIK
jgi:phosphatidate cytidylyltransferase